MTKIIPALLAKHAYIIPIIITLISVALVVSIWAQLEEKEQTNIQRIEVEQGRIVRQAIIDNINRSATALRRMARAGKWMVAPRRKIGNRMQAIMCAIILRLPR